MTGAENLSLAAAPTFAIMALLTATDGQPQLLCSAAHLGSPLGGMVPMYLLMSAFHSGPWLKLISGRRSGASRLAMRTSSAVWVNVPGTRKPGKRLTGAD